MFVHTNNTAARLCEAVMVCLAGRLETFYCTFNQEHSTVQSVVGPTLFRNMTMTLKHGNATRGPRTEAFRVL